VLTSSLVDDLGKKSLISSLCLLGLENSIGLVETSGHFGCLDSAEEEVATAEFGG
jgi:hypothetical protein